MTIRRLVADLGDIGRQLIKAIIGRSRNRTAQNAEPMARRFLRRAVWRGVSHEWEAMVPTAVVDSQGAAKSRASLPTTPALTSASGPVIADRSIRARWLRSPGFEGTDKNAAAAARASAT
jgi:hypothetical protein